MPRGRPGVVMTEAELFVTYKPGGKVCLEWIYDKSPGRQCLGSCEGLLHEITPTIETLFRRFRVTACYDTLTGDALWVPAVEGEETCTDK